MLQFEPPAHFQKHLGTSFGARWYQLPAKAGWNALTHATYRITADISDACTDQPRLSPQHVYVLVNELLKNARWHADRIADPITFAAFTTPDTYSVGCHDGGPYFKRGPIKHLWESGTPIPSTVSPHGSEGNGSRTIKYLAEDLHVDTHQGIIHVLAGHHNPFTAAETRRGMADGLRENSKHYDGLAIRTATLYANADSRTPPSPRPASRPSP